MAKCEPGFFFSLPPTIKTFGLLMMDLYPWLKFIWIWMKSEIYRNETSLPSWFRVHEHLAQHKCCSDGHEQHANLLHVTEMLSTISTQTMLLLQPSVCCLNLFIQSTVRTTYGWYIRQEKWLEKCWNGRNHGIPYDLLQQRKKNLNKFFLIKLFKSFF